MRARGMRAARAKSASYVAEAKGLERRRGLTSFLIWTFFLAEVFGRDAIAPASAHTSEADDPSPAHGNSEVAPATDELAARPMTDDHIAWRYPQSANAGPRRRLPGRR